MSKNLVTLRLGSLPEGDSINRVLILKKGWTDAQWRNGKWISFMVDRGVFDAITKAMQRKGVELLVDYEHQSEPGMRRQDGKVPAAGWVESLEWDEARGVFANIKWTETAAKMIREKEYRYFSPVIEIDLFSNKPVVLHSIALTNTPAMNAIKPIAATATESFTMTEILKALGLQEDATIDQVLTAIASLKSAKPNDDEVAKMAATFIGAATVDTKDKLVAHFKSLAEKKPEPKPDADADKRYTALMTEHTDTLKRLAALEAKNTQAECDELIRKAGEEGKPIKPIEAQVRKLFSTDAQAARDLVKNLQVVVATGQETSNNAPPTGGRAKIIATASSEWASEDDARKFHPVKSDWVNGQLAAAGEGPLTKEEAEKLG